MLNNNHKNLSCDFAEDVISYLYEEISAAEKVAFEEHLKNCSQCIVELSDLGFVRSSIFELRKAEFFDVNAPSRIFTSENTLAETVSYGEKATLLGNLRRFFSLLPSWSAAVLIILIVCSILFLFVFNFGGRNLDVANDKNNQENSIQPIINEKEPEIAAKNSGNETNVKSDSESQPLEIKNTPRITRKNSVEKIANKSRNDQKQQIAAENRNNSAIAQKKSAVNKNSQMTAKNYSQQLKLTNFEEVEDDSLRLADLFAEVESKN